MNAYLDVFLAILCLTKCKKPHSKRQQSVWRVECELGIISDPECPVDGAWAPWGPWSACQGPCDNVGHRHRTRECINPPPSKDGLPCVGPDEQIEACYITNCTVEDYRKIIEGDAARMEALHQLEAVPALLERCLQMNCPFEAIESALATDNTWQLNSESLWNALQCVQHNMGCPVRGGWGSWGPWSACGARCGRGTRWRLRRCDTPPPSAAELACVGAPMQAAPCEGDQCAPAEHVRAAALWGQWGPWTTCSEPCGAGVRRRRRTCHELVTPHVGVVWGTHCRGQHDQLEVCRNEKCILDGGWSGWGAWGPCSQTCGAGRRFRTRSCTRPIPTSRGKPCVGPRTEIGACYLTPCGLYTHTVALLNGDSYLQFNFDKRRSTLFHFYIRFKPLAPHGTLVRRGDARSPLVRASLQRWRVCLDTRGVSEACGLARLCAPASLEPAVWHTMLLTVTTESATLRINDAQAPVKSTFPCNPDFPDELMNIWIGEKLHGEIHEIILNFIPLKLEIRHEHKRESFYPYSASNVAFEKANIEEAFINLIDDQFLRVPCFEYQEEWRLKITTKSIRESGTLLFLRDEKLDSWLLVSLQNNRLKIKLATGDLRLDSTSSTECPPDQWIDVALSKKQETNTIEVVINAGERFHVTVDDENSSQRRLPYSYNRNNSKPCHSANDTHVYRAKPTLSICHNEFFVGGVPEDIQKFVLEDMTPFSGILASLSINSVLQDLHDFSVERFKDNRIQVSSKTASVSGAYHETVWGKSNQLNLTCLYARTLRSPYPAHWLYLDEEIITVVKDKTVRSVDDGRVLKLVTSADNDLRGFYTCRAHCNKRTRNIVTYGVIGEVQYKLSEPDTTTAVAVITTLLLVTFTFIWLIMEGINDLRTGYGFFRDRNLSPQEEAEVVCSYIDQNMPLVGSKSAARMAKARARSIGKRMASRLSFGAQEPEGMRQARFLSTPETSSSTEAEELPALPDIKSSTIEPTHQVYICEPSYVSSPRHGSVMSPRGKISTTSSTMELPSPRVLCSRLLMAKRIYSSRESLISKKGIRLGKTLYNKGNLITIKSSGCINESPAQRILQKFQRLKRDDV